MSRWVSNDRFIFQMTYDGSWISIWQLVATLMNDLIGNDFANKLLHKRPHIWQQTDGLFKFNLIY